MQGNRKSLAVLSKKALKLVISGIGTDPFDPEPPKKTNEAQQATLKRTDLFSVRGGTNGSGLDPIDKPNKTEK